MKIRKWIDQFMKKGWIQPLYFGISKEEVCLLFGNYDDSGDDWISYIDHEVEFYFDSRNREGLNSIFYENNDAIVELSISNDSSTTPYMVRNFPLPKIKDFNFKVGQYYQDCNGYMPIDILFGEYIFTNEVSFSHNDPIIELIDFATFIKIGKTGFRRVCFCL